MRTPPATRRSRAAVALAATIAAGGAHAVAIDLDDPDWSVRFDNTLKGSLMARTEKADPALTDSFRLLVPGVPASAFPQALNFNAGDDNFRERGLVSERLDLLSELDAVYRKDYGVRLSAAAWYDGAYRGKTDAQDPARPALEGTLLLKRVNDVPGATPDQLRWTLRSSTFVEPLERSDRGKP